MRVAVASTPVTRRGHRVPLLVEAHSSAGSSCGGSGVRGPHRGAVRRVGGGVQTVQYYLYRVVTGTRSSRVKRGVHRLVGVDPAAEQTWGVYARSVLAFSAVSILFLYLLLRVQDRLWLSLGRPRSATTSPGTRRSVSPRTPTGRRTPVSRRWVTSCRWPACRCRTHLRVGRHRRRRRRDPRLRGPQERRAGQLLGRCDPDRRARAAARLRPGDDRVDGGRGGAEPLGGHRRHHPDRRGSAHPRRPGRLQEAWTTSPSAR